MTERRCQNCRKFYDKSAGDCTECGHPAYAFNPSLRTAQLNNHLHGMADMAGKEAAWEQQYHNAHQN